MTNLTNNDDFFETKAKLQGSFLLFVQTFYPLLTGREFTLSQPICRESHFITASRALTRAARLIDLRLIINMPPGHGKTTMLCFWVAWTMSMYPDSRYLYICYSKKIATRATDMIRSIIMLPQYRSLFNIRIRHDSKAKEYFETTEGGVVGAFGSESSITGFDGGLPNLDRFSGAIIYDDAHKPDEATSDTMREAVITNYLNTIAQRKRGINVPMILCGQRVHESDLVNFLLTGGDGHVWQRVVLKALDEAENALYPEAFPKEEMLIKREFDIYNFASQFQQDPQPAGGGIFKPEFFAILNEEPKLLSTFITADTAETTDMRNDATVFSLWGYYKLTSMGRELDEYGLHWIACKEIRVEPKDLEDEFLDFWQVCVAHSMPPHFAAIEKKSTGVTLLSILKDLRGLEIRNIERHKSKTQRFLDAQPYIAKKLVSFTKGAEHIERCITQMKKITINETHAHDDIADTCADAVRFAFISKLIQFNHDNNNAEDTMLSSFARSSMQINKARVGVYGNLYK